MTEQLFFRDVKACCGAGYPRNRMGMVLHFGKSKNISMKPYLVKTITTKFVIQSNSVVKEFTYMITSILTIDYFTVVCYS